MPESALPSRTSRLARFCRGGAAIGRGWGEPLLALGALIIAVTCAQNRAGPTMASFGPAPTASSPESSRPRVAPHSQAQAGAGAGAGPNPGTPGHAVHNTTDFAAPALIRFTGALARLMKGEASTSTRVLWFGDSHTAADYFPNAVRKALAKKLTLAGPGYIALGLPGYRHGMAKVWSEGNIEVAPHPPARRTREDDGVFGLGGTRVTLRDATGVVSVRTALEPSSMPMNLELTYRLPDDSDALRVTVAQQRFELTSGTTAPMVGGLRQQLFVATAGAAVEIRASRGRPQIFGISMETQQPGLVIDTLGINGARFGTVLSWHEEALTPLIAQRRPSLLVVAYGTNEVFDLESVERHARRLELVIERLRSGANEADCLVIGPTDVAKGGEAMRARAAAMDSAERAAADRMACAYFSPYELMSDEGGFESWSRQEPPLSVGDGIHLTARGYARLGEALAAQLIAPLGRE